jgi:hypothetical protein
MPRRVIMRIELTPSAKDLLNEFCSRTGTTQVSTMSRAAEWFANQSELIQAAVLRQYPKEIEADVVKLILRRLDERPKSTAARAATAKVS